MLAKMTLRSEEHLEGHILWPWWVVEEGLWAVNVIQSRIDVWPCNLRGFCAEAGPYFAIFVNCVAKTALALDY